MQHRNEAHDRAMELEEQRQAYEGEITRILAMYKQSEVDVYIMFLVYIDGLIV